MNIFISFRRHHQTSGFTLIEMLVVIFIIGIISTLSIANYRRGQKQKLVAIAADTVTNAIRNAQNFSLTSRQIMASNCLQGNSPQSYLILFSSSQSMDLYAVDKCDDPFLIESYHNPTGAQMQNNGYRLDNSPVSSLQIKFTPPFARISATVGNNANVGTFNTFTTATITVESTDGQVEKTVTVDGVSGRIGE